MNRPFDYRGYRFFQASFTPIGRARNITVKAKPANGGDVQEVTIPRDGSAVLAGRDYRSSSANFAATLASAKKTRTKTHRIIQIRRPCCRCRSLEPLRRLLTLLARRWQICRSRASRSPVTLSVDRFRKGRRPAHSLGSTRSGNHRCLCRIYHCCS